MVKEAVKIDKDLLQSVKDLGKFVGRTPITHITELFRKKGVQIFAKREWMQLGGSIKARAAYHIIYDAIARGNLTRDKVLLDATSGNTGIAYASIAEKIGLRVELCLPENASAERKAILQKLGAKVTETSRFEGTDGAQQLASSLAKQFPDKYFYANQYANENNWKAHYYGTALEIFESFPGITHFVAGLGTTGTFVGNGRRLKELNPSIELVSLQPDTPMHGLEGWKHLETAVVPKIYDDSIADWSLEIDTSEAYALIGSAYKQEKLLLSPSSAANLLGAIKIAERIDRGIILTVLPDNADKYSEIVNKIIK